MNLASTGSRGVEVMLTEATEDYRKTECRRGSADVDISPPA